MTSAKKPSPPVDLEVTRDALEKLEAIARQHPELVGHTSPHNVEDWIAVLQNLEDDMTGLKQLGIRWPEDLVERIDAYVEKARKERLGLRFSRSDAIRELVERGLAEEGFGPRVKRTRSKKR